MAEHDQQADEDWRQPDPADVAEREDFEKWWGSLHGTPTDPKSAAWLAWQAYASADG